MSVEKLSMINNFLPACGDIIWLDLSPRTGHEQSEHRPCIVLSHKSFSEKTNMCIICPITSKIKNLPYEIILDCPKTKGAILPIHVRSIDLQARQAKFIEKAPLNIVQKTQDYVRVLVGGT
jgi:mRNA interferase MazF